MRVTKGIYNVSAHLDVKTSWPLETHGPLQSSARQPCCGEVKNSDPSCLANQKWKQQENLRPPVGVSMALPTRAGQMFSIKGQIVNILGFAGHTVSTTLFCGCSCMQYTNKCGCFSTTFYL